MVHGSGFGYMVGTEHPLAGAITHEVSEAPSIQACEISISDTELV